MQYHPQNQKVLNRKAGLPGLGNESKLPLRPAPPGHTGRGSDEEKWAQGIPTGWAIPLISQKPPEVAKATGLLWQIGPTSFLQMKGWDSNHAKIKCKVTLHHRRNLMTNMHAHCDTYFQESKFHTMDSKIIFSTALHYGSNVPLLETNMKCSHMLWNIKKSLNSHRKQNPNVLSFKP